MAVVELAVITGGKFIGKGGPKFVDARGSDCGGASGDKSRTFDLSGVATNEIRYLQGAYLHYPDYSKATVGGVSRITFVNRVYDQFYLRVYYWDD